MDIQLAKIDSAIDPRELHVNMRNDLVRSAQGLTITEKRVISLCLAKLDSVRAKPEGLQNFQFKISAQEFAEAFDLDSRNAYSQLREASDHLLKRIVQVPIKTRGNKVAYKKFQWLSNAEYHPEEGWISLAFHEQMTDKLTFLRHEFTSYKLKHASALRSLYSWRLFELLMQFKKTGQVHISFEEFCTAMEAPPSCVKDYGQLRRRVIEPAVVELQAKNKLIIEWRGIKHGARKITSLEFIFKADPQEALF